MRLWRRDEPRAHQRTFRTKGKHGHQTSTISNPASRKHGNRTGDIDRLRHERDGAEGAGMPTCLTTLRDQDVDARIDGLTRTRNGLRLMNHLDAGIMQRANEGRRIAECQRDRVDALLEAYVKERSEWATEDDGPEFTLKGLTSQGPCFANHPAQIVGAIECHSAQRSEPSLGNRCDEFWACATEPDAACRSDVDANKSQSAVRMGMAERQPTTLAGQATWRGRPMAYAAFGSCAWTASTILAALALWMRATSSS